MCSQAQSAKYHHRRSITLCASSDREYFLTFSHFRLNLALVLLPNPGSCLDLVASISQRGIKGEIRFTSGEDGAPVTVTATADLEVELGAEGKYT